jgi:hypothetical protein
MSCGTNRKALIRRRLSTRDVTEDARLRLADGWTETAFETGTYGPGDTAGLTATLESGSMSLRVLPVRYECSAGVEELDASTVETRFRREGAVPVTADAQRRTAFAAVAEYEPASRRERAVVSVTADAGDALAVCLWLAAAADRDRALARTVGVHEGGAGAVVSDDDALDAQFAAEPGRCIVTGQPTRSHELQIPYRYYPLLAGAKRTRRGVPRFPSTVAALRGTVSHGAWAEHGLGDVALDTPVERAGAGEYRLEPSVATLMADAEAADLALGRLAG